ncbi:hypothetical protein H310_09878 [Aphanomyces invadans]|uniref:C3H1-type domain-containing protein n=1 Tax=Aphanomyces invadans TaxID=157072 RepID=A0A024TSS5_9STRA|nr:hypothetical protein H310_09878 [Aphanomyces invadans]ETV97049.1 hypothetical protein H310_09878 [Aphanomyces invadans]|eukprot:XP_008874295.1 hypothetical protein H310_09878 [Aphanomyces invadans]
MDKQRRQHHLRLDGDETGFQASSTRSGGPSSAAPKPSLFYRDLNFFDRSVSTTSPSLHPAQTSSSDPQTHIDSSMLYYDHPASFPSTNVGTPVFPNRRRKNSIEMFLSRSPSQHLGSDFFKLAMDDPSDFSLDDTSNEGPSVARPMHKQPQLNQPMLQPPPPRFASSRHTYDHDDPAPAPSWYNHPDGLASHASHAPPSRHRRQDSDDEDSSMYCHIRSSKPSRVVASMPRQQHDSMRQDVHPLASWQHTSPGAASYGRPIPSAANSSRRFLMSPDLRSNNHSGPTMLKPCKFFAQGHCRMGNKCKFAHMHSTTAMHSQPSGGPGSASSSFDESDFHPFGYVPSPEPSPFPSILSLDDLRGRVFAMSKDQNGCRLLQEQLDNSVDQVHHPRTATDLCDVIYTESLPHLVDMMVDPFGNYLFQKLLECGTESQRFAIVQQVAHHLVAAALNLHGTRSVQKVVEICSSSSMPQLVELIVDALKDDAVRLCIDSNGNHVIQRALQYMPATYNQFVFDAVSAECTVVGTHRHGCCVLQRCVDAANPAQRREVIAQVEKHAMKLMQDPYGNYVVQYVLDACSTADVVGVMTKCVGHVLELSIQKFSSNVIEKCLELAPDYLCQTFVREIIASPRMHRMLQDQYANYVVQRALSVASDENCLDLVTAMRPHLTSMKNTQGGRRIQARILKRFPHLDVGWDPDFADLAAGSPATGPRQPSIPHHSGGSYGRVA